MSRMAGMKKLGALLLCLFAATAYAAWDHKCPYCKTEKRTSILWEGSCRWEGGTPGNPCYDRNGVYHKDGICEERAWICSFQCSNDHRFHQVGPEKFEKIQRGLWR